MNVYICTSENQLPLFLHGAAHENAIAYLANNGCAIVACRADGQVQVIPEDHIDAEVMRDLLMWAACGRP